MQFALYHPNGEIWNATQVYDQPDYARLLDELGHPHIEFTSPGLISSERWFVDVTARELAERPVMPIEVSASRIKAGRSVVLKNIPAGARFDVQAAGASLHAGPLDGTELEIFIPVPCTYRVQIDLWPYQSFVAEIEAA